MDQSSFLKRILFAALFVFAFSAETQGLAKCPPAPGSSTMTPKEIQVRAFFTQHGKCPSGMMSTGPVQSLSSNANVDNLKVSLLVESKNSRIALWKDLPDKAEFLWKTTLWNTTFSDVCFMADDHFRKVLWDLNGDGRLDLVLEGNDSYCLGMAVFLNQSANPSAFNRFTSLYTTGQDERLLMDLDGNGKVELLIRPGLIGRVGAADIPVGCDEILEKSELLVKEEFLKKVSPYYHDKEGKKPEWVTTPFLPTEKIKIMGFNSKTPNKWTDRTQDFKSFLQWRADVLKKIAANPSEFSNEKNITPACRKKLQDTLINLNQQIGPQ